MTIKNWKLGEDWQLHCDACPEVREYSYAMTFHEMWDVATDEGWRASKEEMGEGKGEWSHTCPACVEAAEECEVNVRKPKASR